MANKREKLIRKLRDALDEDKTLQGDLGIQEVEEALLFLLEEGLPTDNILPEESKIRAGSRDRKSNPEFERNELDNQEHAPAINDEHVQAKPEDSEEHLGNPVDVTENAADVVPSQQEVNLGQRDKENSDSEDARSEPLSAPDEGLPPSFKGKRGKK